MKNKILAAIGITAATAGVGVAVVATSAPAGAALIIHPIILPLLNLLLAI